jgi:rod shape-determining protein MreC
MLSKKMVMIIGVIVLIIANVLILSAVSQRFPSSGPGGFTLSLLAPFQEAVSRSSRFVRDIWRHYFALVSTAQENQRLQGALAEAERLRSDRIELAQANQRLRELLAFKAGLAPKAVAAEVVGRDPSAWYKTVVINKGIADGLRKGLPVMVPLGVAGQVVEVSEHYAQVLLIVDPGSAVDGLVQRSRARGIIRGEFADRCRFEYVLQKEDVEVGDVVITSGLDGVYPKGIPIGEVTEAARISSETFQVIAVRPYVDFERIEEVLVVLAPEIPPVQEGQ